MLGVRPSDEAKEMEKQFAVRLQEAFGQGEVGA